MQVREVMTQDPACCTRDTELTDAARMMVDECCLQFRRQQLE